MVVDTSALAAVLFNEPEAEAIVERLETAAAWRAPRLLPFELANVCRTKIRRDPEHADAYLLAWQGFEAFDLELMDVRLDETLRLAVRLGLSVYDASYLWLALALGEELVTLDAALDRAWHKQAGLRQPP